MAQPWQNAGITATEKGKKELQDGWVWQSDYSPQTDNSEEEDDISMD